jgi:hypothetical protein
MGPEESSIPRANDTVDRLARSETRGKNQVGRCSSRERGAILICSWPAFLRLPVRPDSSLAPSRLIKARRRNFVHHRCIDSFGCRNGGCDDCDLWGSTLMAEPVRRRADQVITMPTTVIS